MTPTQLWNDGRDTMNKAIDKFGIDGGACRIVSSEPSREKFKGKPKSHTAALFLMRYDVMRNQIDDLGAWFHKQGYRGKQKGTKNKLIQ